MFAEVLKCSNGINECVVLKKNSPNLCYPEITQLKFLISGVLLFKYSYILFTKVLENGSRIKTHVVRKREFTVESVLVENCSVRILKISNVTERISMEAQ